MQRHLRTQHLAAIAPHSELAYRQLAEKLRITPRPLVLDSFCGTGHSTALLAQQHPDHLVVGIDKSAQRLAKHIHGDNDNYLLLRADCEDIWALLLRDGLRAEFHYLLYPNPWPKAGHLQRRVHGHASFPLLLRLGGTLELRTNWQLYAEEFGCAMHLSGHIGRVSRLSDDGPAMSLFEHKYRQSGHELWAFSTHMRHGSSSDDVVGIG